MIKLTKEQWLAQYDTKVSDRDMTLMSAAYDVLAKNTVHSPDAPWGDIPVISPWSGPCAGIWNWDSAFHAMTVSRFDTQLAKNCIDCFMMFQKENGLLPDVIFVEGRIADNYGKPPVMPWATCMVFEADGDVDFLRRNYDRFVKHEEFMVRERSDRGLFFYSAQVNPEDRDYLHPRWESGWDNSPRWDGCIVDLWPIDLNCYMILYYRSMAKMAEYLGLDVGEWNGKEKALTELVEGTLYDEKNATYTDRDRKTGEFSTSLSPASFMPLYIGTASAERAAAMERIARDENKFYPGMPTISYDHPEYSLDYWRGPTWINVAYFATKGLKDYGFDQTADAIKEYLLSMIYDELPRGICENYDSKARRGRCNKSFSWTSAFIIEFILNY